MKENKVIHFHLFRPDNSLSKQPKNTPAEIQLIICNNSENCQIFERKECACRYGLFRGFCPYGRLSRQTGYTKRAKKYYSWCREKEERYKGVPFLNEPKKLGIVGEYVFLPYAHMDMLKSLPWNNHFLKREDFTVETIIQLVIFRPQAMMGGEIKSYQEKIPPQFLKHLSEQMPELFQQVIEKSSEAKKRFQEFSNIGRKAILESIVPDVGRFKDIHGGLWTWDGQILHSTNSHASFMLIKKFKEVMLIPEPGQIVEITDEGQVGKDTIFID